MPDGFFDNWTVQLRKGLLEMCILTAMSSQRLYGYDLVRQLREIEGLVISEGTIYPILSRFKREGLVRTTLEESNEGPARKYYQLTDFGREIVARMIQTWQMIVTGVQTIHAEKG